MENIEIYETLELAEEAVEDRKRIMKKFKGGIKDVILKTVKDDETKEAEEEQ